MSHKVLFITIFTTVKCSISMQQQNFRDLEMLAVFFFRKFYSHSYSLFMVNGSEKKHLEFSHHKAIMMKL